MGDRAGFSDIYNSNNLFIEFGYDSVCTHKYAYLENTAAAYDSTLSMLIAAKLSGVKIRVVVSDIDSDPGNDATYRIEFVNLN